MRLRIVLLLILLSVVPCPAWSAAPPAPKLDRSGDPLPAGAVMRLGSIRFRHGGVAEAVAWSPDGKLLASGGKDRAVRLWAADTGKLLHTMTGPQGDIWAVTFSPDGKTLASGSLDVTIRLWDVDTGRETRIIRPEQHSLSSLVFSPDGKMLASGNMDGGACLWDAKTGNQLFKLSGHRGDVRSVAFSSDGKFLASAGHDGTVRLWDPAKGKLLRQIKNAPGSDNPDALSPMAFAGDGKTLAIALAADNLVLVNPASGKELRRWPLGSPPVVAVAFSKDGKSIATADAAGVRIWEAATGKMRCACGSKRPLANGLAFAPDSRTLATAEGNGIRLWDAASGKEIERATGHSAPIKSLALSVDGKTVITGGEDGTIRFWEHASGKELRRLSDHAGVVNAVALSRDGKLLASAGGDAAVILWDPSSGARVRQLAGNQPGISSLAFSPDGKTLAVGGREKSIQLWDPQAGTLRGKAGFHVRGGISGLAWSPDGKLLTSRGNDSRACVLEMPAGKQRHSIDCGRGGGALAFAPNGKVFAAGARVFEPELARRLLDLKSGGSVHAVGFSPDSKLLGRGSDAILVVWDADTGKELKRYRGHSGDIGTLAFTHDGHVITGSGDGTALIWDLKAEGQAAPAVEPGRRRPRGDVEPPRSNPSSPQRGRGAGVRGQDKPDSSPGPAPKPGQADAEGNPLPAGAVARLGSARMRHGEQVGVLSFSADGKTLASGGSRLVRLWDVATGKEQSRFAGPNDRLLNEVRFAADGKTLLVVGHTSAIWYDLSSGEEKLRFGGDPSVLQPFVVSPDGKLFASCRGRTVGASPIQLSDTAGKKQADLEGDHGRPHTMAFSPDGQTLVGGSRDGTIHLWDVKTGKGKGKWAGHNGVVLQLYFSPDSKVLASVAPEGTRLWEIATGKNFAMLANVVPGVSGRSLAFAPDGKTFAVVDGGGWLKLFTTADGKCVKRWYGHKGTFGNGLAFSPDGKMLASGGLDGPIRLWDVATGQEIRRPEGHQEALSQIALAEHNGMVTISAGSARRWDPAGKEVWRVEGRGGRRHDVAISSDGRWLAVCKTDASVTLYDAVTGKEKRTLVRSTPTDHTPTITFVPSSSFLAVALGKSVQLLDIETGEKKLELEGPPDGCAHLAAAPDGRHLAAHGNNDQLWVLDIAGRKTLHELKANNLGVRCLSFSPDGRTLAAGCMDGSVHQWELATGKPRPKLHDDTGDVTCMVFAAGGQVLITGEPQRLRYWDRVGGKVFHETDSAGPVTCLASSVDDRRLISGSSDGTALVWDLSRLLSQASPRRSPELTAKQLDQLWADLGGDDSQRSWRAACSLAAAPKQTLPLVEKELASTLATDDKRLALLLKELDSDEFAIRERATDELTKMGRRADAAVRKALEGTPSAEARQRLKAILARTEKAPSAKKKPASSSVLASRTVEVLELMAGGEGRPMLEKWAKADAPTLLADEARAALKRLASRSGKSP